VAELDLQAAQNVFFDIGKKTYPQISKNAQSGDQKAQKWVEHFRKLANYLGVMIQ
jgi:hypothetical protein